MFGKWVGNTKQGWVLWIVSAILFVIGLAIVIPAEQIGNPILSGLGANQQVSNYQAGGNMEGKEVRYGITVSSLQEVTTTATSTGTVMSFHDSYTPLGGMVLMGNIALGEIIFGGVGAGLYSMLMFAIIGVFIAGLMVGRTPEYLGKKIEAREMKLAMLAFLIHPLMILGPAGVFAVSDWGTKATNNPAAHGFSEVLYEFTSASSNNGSGLEGLGDTYGFAKAEDNRSPPAPYSVHWDIACGLVLIFGRFIPIIAPLAFAASLAAKRPTP